MAFYRMLIVDLFAGAFLVAMLSTVLERTVLNSAMEDPVRGHLISLFLGWLAAVVIVMLMSPWRYEVPLMYAIAAAPIAIVQVKRGRRERRRIGYVRRKS